MANKVDTSNKTTKTLADVLIDTIDAQLLDTHVAMPGEIVSYNALLNQANVKPLLQRKYLNQDTPVNLPVIPNVPIIFPRTKTSWIRLPIAVGDTVLLVFNERAIDVWKMKGGSVDPKFSRKHDLADAVAIPGFYPATNPIVPQGAAGDLEITNGLSTMLLQKNGKIKFGNGAVDLLALFDELVGDLVSALVPTAIGLQNFDPATLIKLNALKLKIDLLKG